MDAESIDLRAPRTFSFDCDSGVNDLVRLERLKNTGLLGRPCLPALEAITRLASVLTGAPTSVISLVDADRQVFPSVHSPEGRDLPAETPLSHSFCKYVVANDAPLVVDDVTTHPVLKTHPAALDGLLKAYAGYPVHAPTGEVLGALCVIDDAPRTWTGADLRSLRDLATLVDTKIELRLNRRDPTSITSVCCTSSTGPRTR